MGELLPIAAFERTQERANGSPLIECGQYLESGKARRPDLLWGAGTEACTICAMDNRISVLCVDDHQIVREGIVAIIGRQADMTVTGTAANGLQAVDAFLQNPPDVTLMDLQLPVLSGLDAIRRIRSVDAHAKIIVLTTYHGDEDVHQALAAGAATYVLKEAVLDDLASVVRAVHNGARPLSEDVQRILSAREHHAHITAREVDVLELIAQGLRNKDIGQALGITEETVKVHVRNIMSKLNAQDRTEAVTKALRRGVIHLY
jgi:two-component system NarL family response regulator